MKKLLSLSLVALLWLWGGKRAQAQPTGDLQKYQIAVEYVRAFWDSLLKDTTTTRYRKATKQLRRKHRALALGPKTLVTELTRGFVPDYLEKYHGVKDGKIRNALAIRVGDSLRAEYAGHNLLGDCSPKAFVLQLGLKERLFGPLVFFSCPHKNTLFGELKYFDQAHPANHSSWWGISYRFFMIFDDNNRLVDVLSTTRHYN
jgi:hypothetical protein